MHHDLELEAAGVRLVPLAVEHATAMLPLIDEVIWAGMVTPTPRSVQDVVSRVEAALAAPGTFAFTVLGPDGEVRGWTSFYDVVPAQERCEIGSTWYARRWWGGVTNPACKLALMTQGFESWGMHRIGFRADARNDRSIAALTRLGAQPEGVLRGHRIAADGSRGDTAYFSVLADEWPRVRDGLRERLAVR
ncbi:GNAT family N-acetyltransferase [Actinotalea sp.]|uniref:GNAT family N-acetyltransferase n=1 Tax=Actinotalea sp. TaxID=1872145 RepID=UPI00356A5F3A